MQLHKVLHVPHPRHDGAGRRWSKKASAIARYYFGDSFVLKTLKKDSLLSNDLGIAKDRKMWSCNDRVGDGIVVVGGHGSRGSSDNETG